MIPTDAIIMIFKYMLETTGEDKAKLSNDTSTFKYLKIKYIACIKNFSSLSQETKTPKRLNYNKNEGIDHSIDYNILLLL